MRKLLVCFLLLSMICGTIQAVNPNEKKWNNYYQDSTITISFMYINCEYTDRFDTEYVLLKIRNTGNTSKTIEWTEELWYDNKCINCETDSDEYRKMIQINEQDIVTGDCVTYNDLRIFSKYTSEIEEMPGLKKIYKLTNFKLNNITIK